MGTSDAASGHAHLQGAFAKAAVLFLRNHTAAQKSLARLEKKPDKGQALIIVAQKLARAVYYMRKRKVAGIQRRSSTPQGGERRSLKPHSPMPAMDCKAGRVPYAVRHPLGHSPAVAPKAIAACLVTASPGKSVS